MAGTQYVTPTLFLSEPPQLSRTARVSTLLEAVAVIRAGGVAVLPEGEWDLAEQVLATFNTPEHLRAQMHFAKTGRAAQ